MSTESNLFSIPTYILLFAAQSQDPKGYAESIFGYTFKELSEAGGNAATLALTGG